MRVCVFDLDHTLIRSPLNLAAMALDMRALLESCHGPLPSRDERYRVGELITYCRHQAPALEHALWAVALAHERRALGDAALEPGAREALLGSRAAGWGTAVWTNNARAISLAALERFGLLPHLDLVVTRDDMTALKPDPDGWRVIAERLAPAHAVVVGDSWVDGLAAAAAGVPFVAYRPDQAELTRRGVSPLASLTDLAGLPSWLTTFSLEGAEAAPSKPPHSREVPQPAPSKPPHSREVPQPAPSEPPHSRGAQQRSAGEAGARTAVSPTDS